MNDILQIINDLADLSKAKNVKLASAESCTGGLISKYMTDIAGSSSFYESSIIAYSNNSKERLLDVSRETLQKYGAVSKNVVLEMSAGLLQKCDANVVVAVSGIMGPDKDQSNKQIGEVWLCWKGYDVTNTSHELLDGDRNSNRENTAKIALLGLYDFIKGL